MYDFHPHTFDTRGFAFASLFLMVILILFSAVRFGTLYASERITEAAQIDLAPIESQKATLRAAHEAAIAETQKPSRFTVRDRPLPKLSAKAFLIGDMDSNTIFAQKNATEVRPFASLTKLLVALIVRETFTATSTVTITRSDRQLTEGTPGSITRDESFTVTDTLRALLMESNNSAAYAFARAAGFETFMEKLRVTAKNAGMASTSLEDPSGISEKNAASAADIFALTRYIYANDAEIFDMTRTRNATIVAESGRKYSLRNFNIFARDPRFVGGKTGYTDDARETMTAIFKVSVADQTATIVIVILGSEDRKKDVEKLLAWFNSAVETQ